MWNRLRTVISIAAAIVLASVAGGHSAFAQPNSGKGLANPCNEFGFNLFEQLRNDQLDRNIFISPASVMLALAMVYNGADGETKAQMDEALALHGMSIDSVNQSAGELMNWLSDADTSVQLAIANSVWAKPGFPFKESFIDLTREEYDAEIRELTTASEINSWVSEKTRGKIPKIIDQIGGDAIMYLINAIYFNGSWAKKFPERNTRERDFDLLSGETIQHDLMENQGEYPYWGDSTVQAIKLPYGNGNFGMVVLLPREDYPLEQFAKSLTTDKWNSIYRRLYEHRGNIVLPRFTIEYAAILNDALMAMGMTDAFSDTKADFTKMWDGGVDSNVCIDEVRHKTFVKVNEEGTEAAAVTSVSMKCVLTSVDMSPPPFEMIVDRPFVCAIVDGKTGMILFLGAIVDPRG